MKTLSPPLVIGAFLLATALSSPGDITPISSSINLTADANAGAGDTQNQNSASQTTTLNGLTNTVTAQAVNGGLTATTETDATATWTSASAGTFSLHDNFTSDNLSQYNSSRVAMGGSPWVYTFHSTAPGIFTVNYSVGFSGSFPYGTELFMNQLVGTHSARGGDNKPFSTGRERPSRQTAGRPVFPQRGHGLHFCGCLMMPT